MYSKPQIFNLALSNLLLTRSISNAETDASNEAKVLQTHWEPALRSTLADLDLDGTSSQVTLELIEENPNDLWLYSYKKPEGCALFRRIVSCVATDNRYTHIPKRLAVKDGRSVIFTNEASAVAEYIPDDVPLTALNASAGLALAARLAELSAPLIVGKGALKLREDIRSQYVVHKAEAQELDKLESFSFNDEMIDSEFVAARMS